MQGRYHHLEIALEQAILNRDILTVSTLVPLLPQVNGANLRSLDYKGESFLANALAIGATEIAAFLLKSYKDDKDILLALDKQQASLFWHAANTNQSDVIVTLLEYAELFENKSWLTSNIHGVRYTGIKSLRELLIAQHEFNLILPIRNTALDARGNENFIHLSLFEQMPLYRRRVQQAAQELGLTAMEEIQAEKKALACEWLAVVANDPNIETYKLADTDRIKLQQGQTRGDTLNIFSELKEILKTLRTDISKTHRPLSLFSPSDTVIDIRDAAPELPARAQEKLQIM